MSISIYRSESSSNEVGTTVRPYAVEHKSNCLQGKGRSIDSDLKELTPACLEAGCRLGYLHTSYRGLVVSTRERNGYDDSDFLATVVVNEETMETEEICYATTRGWTYFNSADVDAPTELIARWRDKLRAAAQAADEAREAASKALPKVGRRVVVTSKRSSIPEGTEGTVCYFGVSQYAPFNVRKEGGISKYTGLQRGSLKHYRVGILLADGSRVYCTATCVKVIQPQEVG